MAQFEEIVDKVNELMIQKHPAIIAISGFGGSGKTTLANRIHDRIKDSALLQLDNFLVNRGEGSGWQGGYDWKRFEQVLMDVEAGKDLQYQWYNWDKNETKEWVHQPLPSLVIVEGVRLFYPELMKHFDLSIWMDVSLDAATEQGKARDAANKSSDSAENVAAHLAKWDEVWIPKEQEFATLFHPIEVADIRFK